MRCKLVVLTFAISIVPAVANAALTTTIDIGKITCIISSHAACTVEQVLCLDERLV